MRCQFWALCRPSLNSYLGVRCSASGVRLSLSLDRKDLHTSYFNLDEANLTLPGTERAELIRRDHPL